MPRYPATHRIYHPEDNIRTHRINRDVAIAEAPTRAALIARQVDEQIDDSYRQMRGDGSRYDVAAHSYFRDLLTVVMSERRARESLDRAVAEGGVGGRDPGVQVPSMAFPSDSVEQARSRLTAALRDLSV